MSSHRGQRGHMSTKALRKAHSQRGDSPGELAGASLGVSSQEWLRCS